MSDHNVATFDNPLNSLSFVAYLRAQGLEASTVPGNSHAVQGAGVADHLTAWAEAYPTAAERRALVASRIRWDRLPSLARVAA